MTLAGMTPAEQVRALNLAVGDTIEDRHEYRDGSGWHMSQYTLLYAHNGALIWRNRWAASSQPDHWNEGGIYEGGLGDKTANWRKISSDPSIDPAEPLRRELREAHKHLAWFRDLSRGCMATHEIQPVVEWLARNAAFGAGEVGHE